MQPDQTPPAREPGTVYTFYSFKGGVGRSMALANIAALLAKAGRKILAVDWDLEAPGLEKYFQTPPEAVREKPGLIDWEREASRLAAMSPDRYSVQQRWPRLDSPRRPRRRKLCQARSATGLEEAVR